MAATSIGLIETRGLVGTIAAADTAAKAADVQLLGVEQTGGGFVSVRNECHTRRLAHLFTHSGLASLYRSTLRKMGAYQFNASQRFSPRWATC